MTDEGGRESLEALRSDVSAMGKDTVAQLEKALDSLETGDETLAREVIEGDERLNETYLALESQCVDLFGQQEAFAGDLRFITASFKIITDLERIGDLATNLSEYALAAKHELIPDDAVDEIGRDALSMVERSLAAYEASDSQQSREVVASDDQIDELCRTASETVTRDLIEREAESDGPWMVEQLLDDVTRVLLTIRDIERVGDHAVNIAARTYYMVESDPKFIY
ncbi:phosphate signaling complex protein PhoU [Halovenus sp. WSH3]|uniref:Phosphate-specific transport system accessory protein PhoU n=1 Tax=Halovenus carboxidivorans TaxID=2692199 RepID=A0A6B0T6B7_9EURY|nr:phosphate signaling complex protein PhoU [Halovenus carboxidivorans]MXR52467.1 phosphate signaling complex protein PhoU [Halovenus carboxidivorans]